MNIYIPLGLFLVLLCWATSAKQRSSVGAFLFSMCVIAVFGAIRYKMGNDYSAYLNTFALVKDYDYSGYYLNVASRAEPGFIYLLSLFPSYFLFIIFLTTMWHALISFICVRYIRYNYLWFALIIILFDQHYVIQNYVALRSSVVCCLFMVAFLLIMNKRTYWAAAVILIASTLHLSSIVLLPFVFSNFWIKVGKSMNLWLLFPLFVVLFIFHQVFTDFLTRSIVENFSMMERYEGYIEAYNQKGLSIGAIIDMLVSLVPPILMIKIMKKEKDDNYLYIILIAIFISLANVFIGSMMIRYYMYFGPVILIAYFRTVRYLRGETSILYFSLFAVTAYNFFQLQSAKWFESFLLYKTIFESPNWQ